MEKALGSPSQCYCHPLEALPCLADGIFLVFSDAFYKPQSCQPKLSWKHVALCASSSKNAAPFEELFLKELERLPKASAEKHRPRENSNKE